MVTKGKMTGFEGQKS